MNVLSIDWDFFQEADKDTLKKYPDGLDLGRELSEIVWGVRYMESPELMNVQLAADEFEYIKELLQTQERTTPVMIANSHKHAHDFILAHAKISDSISVTNIDMHHDIVNGNSELDCGNWIGHLFSSFSNIALKWVHHPVSFSVYGIDLSKRDAFSRCIARSDGGETVRNLLGHTYDIIFIAKSETWIPVHLDPYFSYLTEVCLRHFDNVRLEKNINDTRNFVLRELTTANAS